MACGGGNGETTAIPQTPYTNAPGNTVVIGEGRGGTVFATPGGSACIQLGSECVRPQDKCGAGARADVIVDSKGKVVQIVCYPNVTDPPVVDTTGPVDLDKQNNGVIRVDGANDGVDIAGDVASKGNNVTVYGQGADVSIIGGSVSADGNNFSLRGVTVKGNVTVTANNATLVLCIIEGNLTITGNDAVVAECTVKGNIILKGNNDMLVSNKLQGTLSVDGKNTVCDGNVTLTGTPVTCGDGKK